MIEAEFSKPELDLSLTGNISVIQCAHQLKLGSLENK